MTIAPSFPPLLSGEAVTGGIDPFDKACAMATLGCDAGTIVHNVQAETLRAAMVFAPEVALKDAVAMMPACGVGFQNALGALGPPEVAVHLEWAGGIRVNAARCGRLRLAASGSDPNLVPDWLIVGLDVPLIPPRAEMGETPDDTALYAEGCAEVEPVPLLESWARHTLVWINRWSEGGVAPLHAEWRAMAFGIGQPIDIFCESGTYLGVDERFGLLLRDGADTTLFPLTRLLEDAP